MSANYAKVSTFFVPIMSMIFNSLFVADCSAKLEHIFSVVNSCTLVYWFQISGTNKNCLAGSSLSLNMSHTLACVSSYGSGNKSSIVSPILAIRCLCLSLLHNATKYALFYRVRFVLISVVEFNEYAVQHFRLNGLRYVVSHFLIFGFEISSGSLHVLPFVV